MKYLMLLSLFMAGCTGDYSIPVGTKVTNCSCDGYVSQVYGTEYRISPADCGDVSFNFIVEKKINVNRYTNKSSFCRNR